LTIFAVATLAKKIAARLYPYSVVKEHLSASGGDRSSSDQ
jgi:hypothetical protein